MNIQSNDSCDSLNPKITQLTEKIKRFIRVNGIQEIIIFGYGDPNIHTHYWIHNAFFGALKSIDIAVPVKHLSAIPNELIKKVVLCLFTYDNKNNYHEGAIFSKNWFYLMLNHTYDYTYPDFIKQATTLKKAIVFHVFRGETTGLSSSARQWPHSLDSEKMRYSLTWAARSPPSLIRRRKNKLPLIMEDRCVFIGTVWHRNIEQINELAKWCVENAVPLDVIGQQYEKINVAHPDLIRVQNRTISDDEAMDIIIRVKYAPALQGKSQLPYIPCRAFINASYGRHVLTNNWAVKKMLPFAIYHSDTFQLMDSAKQTIRSIEPLRVDFIEDIEENHTYINRICELLSLFSY